MLRGTVSALNVPEVELSIGGRAWIGIIDTGFNGDVELPLELREVLDATLLGTVESSLAGGQRIVEDCYLVEFEFDGHRRQVEATFAQDARILIGTRLLLDHHLEIDFPARSVVVQRGFAATSH